ERPEAGTVPANVQPGPTLEHLVVAPDRRAAAILAGAADVLDEFGAMDTQRLLRLGDLDGRHRHVRHEVRIAVEAVRPGAAAPRRAEELDEDEGLPVRVVAADRDAGVAALGGGDRARGEHLGERTEAGVDHPESGEPASG